jgi:hypothetical protein
MIVRADGRLVGCLCTNILEGRISFRSKLLAISNVQEGYAIGVSSSLQIVIDPKYHAVAFTKLHDHIVARIPNRFLSRPSSRSTPDRHTSLRSFSNGSDREGRQTTRFLRSQRSSSSSGYRMALPILMKTGRSSSNASCARSPR